MQGVSRQEVARVHPWMPSCPPRSSSRFFKDTSLNQFFPVFPLVSQLVSEFSVFCPLQCPAVDRPWAGSSQLHCFLHPPSRSACSAQFALPLEDVVTFGGAATTRWFCALTTFFLYCGLLRIPGIYIAKVVLCSMQNSSCIFSLTLTGSSSRTVKLSNDKASLPLDCSRVLVNPHPRTHGSIKVCPDTGGPWSRSISLPVMYGVSAEGWPGTGSRAC